MNTGTDRVASSEGSVRDWLSPAVTVRILHVVLWLLVVSGPAAALIIAGKLASLDARVDAAAAQPATATAIDTSGAEGFAELFIASYVAAGAESSGGAESILGADSPTSVQDGAWSATSTVSLGAQEVAPGYYAVTVAAEVVAHVTEPGRAPATVPTGTRFFAVGVAETRNGWTATGLPSLISAPPNVEAPALLVDRLDGLDVEPAVAELLAEFFAAYLASEGDLTRYVAPALEIVAVQPPPFVEIEVAAAGSAEPSDGVTPISVLVRGTDSDGRAQLLEYSLMVSQRDGRWEVSDLLPAPLLVTTDTD
ncbi:MAG: conjugal transfer protein [Acidimicrobiia bacterium]|nr:conjugal transfer protein [Acidimicrobiia bacterium]